MVDQINKNMCISFPIFKPINFLYENTIYSYTQIKETDKYTEPFNLHSNNNNDFLD